VGRAGDPAQKLLSSTAIYTQSTPYTNKSIAKTCSSHLAVVAVHDITS
jgi:hypothetical protein